MKHDSECRLDGNSVIVARSLLCNVAEVLEHHIMHLSLVRNAQIMKLRVKTPASQDDGGRIVWVVNTHLHHTIQDAMIRYH